MSLLTIDKIEADTPLWRYMGLSKFMLLLRGKAFIPCLSTLKKDSDPKENVLPADSETDLAAFFFAQEGAGAAQKWLDERIAGMPQPHLLSRSDQLFKEWHGQLAARRAVWCWGSTADLQAVDEPWESLAMWNSYARSGVAVKTDFQSLQRAVEASPCFKDANGIALKVQYFWQKYSIQGLFEDGSLKRPFRPLAFKHKSYAYEAELRIVFRVSCSRDLPPGVLVDIDPNILLGGGEVAISPYMQRDEAHAVASMVERWLNNPKIKVRRSTEWTETTPEIDEWIRGLPNHQWPGLFEKETGLPDLLHEL